MENLIWLIAIGALFFFMMRWGCGAGHGHGGDGKEHDHAGSGDPPGINVKEPGVTKETS